MMNNFFNDDYNISEYNESFKKHKVVEIENFFDNTFANKLSKEMIDQHENGLDFATSFPFTKRQTHNGIPNLPENQEYIKEAHEFALKHYNDNEYSRFYYRISTTGPNCTECLGSIKEMFKTSYFINKMKKITGLNELFLLYVEPFVYTKDCFLSIHTDSLKQNRVVAAVVHLSKDWEKEDGGVYIYSSESDKVNQYIPKFNNVLITDIRNEQLPHAVTIVKSSKPRLTIAAWFSDKEISCM